MTRRTPAPSFTRRSVLAQLGAGALAAGSGLAHAADAWPVRPLRIIVPFAPGGGSDIAARALGEQLAAPLGQSVVVENKPGAGSAIGVLAAAQARDGHTLLMGSNSMVINPSLNPQIGYDVARDFDAVCMVSSQPLVLVVPGSSAIRTLPDLVAAGKARPGALTAGNSGNGTLAHLAAELLAGQAGFEVTPVPYKGESALLPDLIGGLVSFGLLNLPSVLPHLRSGKLRALAVTTAQPVADLPGVPQLHSLGLPGLELMGWSVLVAPKGSIPADGLARLGDQVARAQASEPVRTRFGALGLSTVVQGPAATAAFLQAESARYAGVIRSRGIKL